MEQELKVKVDKNELRTVHMLNKEECCGCYACYNICSQNAITMLPDEEGFNYPLIDNTLCINCALCIKVCPAIDSECLDLKN